MDLNSLPVHVPWPDLFFLHPHPIQPRLGTQFMCRKPWVLNKLRLALIEAQRQSQPSVAHFHAFNNYPSMDGWMDWWVDG